MEDWGLGGLCSRIAALGFRQGEAGQDDQRVAAGGNNADHFTQRHGGADIRPGRATWHRRPPEVVAKPLSEPRSSFGEQFGWWEGPCRRRCRTGKKLSGKPGTRIIG